jgi:hypothetical protein
MRHLQPRPSHRKCLFVSFLPPFQSLPIVPESVYLVTPFSMTEDPPSDSIDVVDPSSGTQTDPPINTASIEGNSAANESDLDVTHVHCIEADTVSPDGTVQYLVHWISDPNPATFTWRPREFFSRRQELVDRYWRQKTSRLRTASVQTEGRFFVQGTLKPPKPMDPFSGFDPGQIRETRESSPIPIRVIGYSKESHSFRVLMSDQAGEAEMSERALLAMSPGLIVDFFLGESR